MASTTDAAAADTSTSTTEVDEKLYSRQLYVMGHEAQRRMMASRAVIIGISGLGVEIAKNIILAGISSVTLCDPEVPNSFDLGGNFYLGEEDLNKCDESDGNDNDNAKKGRAALCMDQLSELNEYVKVDVATNVTSLQDEAGLLSLVDGASVVVITVPLSTSTLCAINEKCRASADKTCFIYTLTTGVFGSVFCDFGEAFVISDKDGENPATSQVENILTR